MGSIVKLQGFVSQVADCGEADRMLTLITRECGKLSVYARGCRKLTSKTMTASQQFAFGDYVISRTDKLNVLQEASVKQCFFGLRKNIASMALACYIAEVTSFVTMPEEPEQELYDLTLNALYLLSENKKPLNLVKSAYELKAASYLGFLPDINGCRVCGKSNCGDYLLDVMNGNIICRSCREKSSESARGELYGEAEILAPLSEHTLAAVRYIIGCEPGRVFSFNAADDVMSELSYAAEKYLINQLERSFSTLDFYKDMTRTANG